VENVENVEDWWKKLFVFLFFLSDASVLSDVSDFSCQAPIDILISRP
jgi:hypothetical protein